MECSLHVCEHLRENNDVTACMYLEIFFFLNSDYFYLKTTPNFTLQKHFKNTPNNNLKYDKIWKNLNMTINIVPTEPIKDYSITISIKHCITIILWRLLPPVFFTTTFSNFVLLPFFALFLPLIVWSYHIKCINFLNPCMTEAGII